MIFAASSAGQTTRAWDTYVGFPVRVNEVAPAASLWIPKDARSEGRAVCRWSGGIVEAGKFSRDFPIKTDVDVWRTQDWLGDMEPATPDLLRQFAVPPSPDGTRRIARGRLRALVIPREAGFIHLKFKSVEGRWNYRISAKWGPRPSEVQAFRMKSEGRGKIKIPIPDLSSTQVEIPGFLQLHTNSASKAWVDLNPNKPLRLEVSEPIPSKDPIGTTFIRMSIFSPTGPSKHRVAVYFYEPGCPTTRWPPFELQLTVLPS